MTNNFQMLILFLTHLDLYSATDQNWIQNNKQQESQMDCCFSSLNTKGFSSALSYGRLPPSSHITYGGCFNQLKFSIGPKAVKPLQLHIGYARAQNQNSIIDNKINDYLAIFTKGSKDGAERDGRNLNAVIMLDVSGSMGSGLTSNGQGCRIQLAKEAILMFFSKLRKTDSFGLITFNQQGHVLITLQRVNNLQLQVVSAAVRGVQSGGGTTLLSGLQKANQQFKSFLQHNSDAKSCNNQNRIIMLTDVQDNSIGSSKQFIKQVQKSNIHTTIIGISDDFKSDVCEQLVQVKGFNYFCATQIQDLDKYLFRNFDFTFFPANFDNHISIQSQNVKGVQVFGTPDAEKVPLYNVNSTNTFTITHYKTSFPSELELTQQGDVKTYGGLILVKLNLRNKALPAFDATINLKYRTSSGQNMQDVYKVHYQAPVNEQFYSQQSLFEALSAFFYAYEVKNILKSVEQLNTQTLSSDFLASLQGLRTKCPQSKKKQLQDLISTANKNKKNRKRQRNGDRPTIFLIIYIYSQFYKQIQILILILIHYSTLLFVYFQLCLWCYSYCCFCCYFGIFLSCYPIFY